MWAFETEAPWGTRAFAGAVIGAVLLGGLPAVWRWAKEREAVHNPSPLIPAARLQQAEMESWPPEQDQPIRARVKMTNPGSAAAANIQAGWVHVIGSKELSSGEETSYARQAVAALPAVGSGGSEFQPGQVAQFWIALAGESDRAAYDKVINGTLRLYIFLAVQYTDHATPPGKRIITQVCHYYQGGLNQRHLCSGGNRVFVSDAEPARPGIARPTASSNPAKKRYTQYDIESRQRAIDEFYRCLDEDATQLYAYGRDEVWAVWNLSGNPIGVSAFNERLTNFHATTIALNEPLEALVRKHALFADVIGSHMDWYYEQLFVNTNLLLRELDRVVMQHPNDDRAA
jgi:hypothetical protein